jgi:pantoate--beta-alanine ligase
MRRLADELRGRGRLGFVPTMGALHEGHLSLVRRARRSADATVVSVFVNPLQFGPREDFRRYPRAFARDRRLLGAEGTDVVFRPSVREMYPGGFAASVEVERLTRYLCGASRPGHFRGVLTVVAKLLNIVRPHVAVFGQKDAQQAFVVRRMVRDLDIDTRVVMAPTVREPDGLAMSSRNAYLTARQRRQAPVLYRALRLARGLVRAGERDAERLRAVMRRMVESQSSGRVDYIEVADTSELAPVRRLRGEVLVALAVAFGRTRLIDNLLLRV